MYDLFSDFFDSFELLPVYREDRRCKNCGKSYYDFKKTGRLGCGKCYEEFETPVRSTLMQMQKSTTHTGKIPSKQSAGLLKKRKLADLKMQLERAVNSEDYELAAKLHKEIKGLEG